MSNDVSLIMIVTESLCVIDLIHPAVSTHAITSVTQPIIRLHPLMNSLMIYDASAGLGSANLIGADHLWFCFTTRSRKKNINIITGGKAMPEHISHVETQIRRFMTTKINV